MKWKAEFQVFPLENLMAQHVQADMKTNYFKNKENFWTLSSKFEALFRFDNLKFSRKNSLEIVLYGDDGYGSPSGEINNSNIDKFTFKNGEFLYDYNDKSYFVSDWIWKFNGRSNDKNLQKYLSWKEIDINEIIEIKDLMNKINCYSVSSDGVSYFQFGYDKYKFLNLDYFTEHEFYHDHLYTQKLDEVISIGKCLNPK